MHVMDATRKETMTSFRNLNYRSVDLRQETLSGNMPGINAYNHYCLT